MDFPMNLSTPTKESGSESRALVISNSLDVKNKNSN